VNQPDVVWNPTLGLYVPRVTSALRVMDKYHLRRWYATEAAINGVLEGRSIAFDDELDIDNRAKFCVEAVDQYVAETADFGTEVHQWLAAFNRGDEQIPSGRIAKVVAPWPAWFDKHVGRVYRVEQQVFGKIDGLHYGGTLDLLVLLLAGTKLGHTGRTLENDTVTIADFKTSPQYYDEMGYQLAPYHRGVCELSRTALDVPFPEIRITVRLDREKPGKVYCKEWLDYDNDLGMFRDCLSIWYRLNQHRLTDMVQSSSTQKEIACLASNSTPSTN